jgi:predicted kinase
VSRTYAIHACSFDSGIRRTNYETLKADALKAGRFSVFEATSSQRAARLFTRLCRDPEVVTTPEHFPWTKVAKRKGGAK